MWDMVERKHLNKLLGDDDKSSVADSIIAGTAHDKGRLIRGQATEITDHRVMVLDINKALQAMRSGQAQDAMDVDNSVDIVVDKCPNG